MLHGIELLAAVFSASLIGSLHCVGMCGPFAAMASFNRSQPASSSYLLIAGYHLGRLLTYLVLGAIAGAAGGWLNRIGERAGVAQTAAVLVGASLLAMGVFRLVGLFLWNARRIEHSYWLQQWTRGIMAIGKRLRPSSPSMRALVIGMITTWLPCGWLYLFALAASSAGSILGAMMVMVAFWIGTLPLLSMVAIGTQSIGLRVVGNGPLASTRNRTSLSLQGIAAFLMIAFGGYTLCQRSTIQLDSLKMTRANSGVLTSAAIHRMTDEPLPCCREGAHSSSAKAEGEPHD